MSDDFDDLGMYRRKVEKLEQTIATMALEIGVLKQERAHLWMHLKFIHDNPVSYDKSVEHCAHTKALLDQIKIS